MIPRRTSNKRLRITLRSHDKKTIYGSASISLPPYFSNADTTLSAILKLEWQVERPANMPRQEMLQPDPLPLNYDGDPMPWYPMSYTLSADDMVTQTDYVIPAPTGVFIWADEFEKQH
jgi:hypothetical protein